MEESPDFYPTLLQVNQASFAQGKFRVAYHALSGALYCALALGDKEKLAHVQQLAQAQLSDLQKRFIVATLLGEQEVLEITLYRSLACVAEPRRLSFFE